MPAKNKISKKKKTIVKKSAIPPVILIKDKVKIFGNIKGERLSSKILEEYIQQAVKDGAKEIHIIADGQHGIGGRLWPRGETINIIVEGPVGQRLGSMGMFGTDIIIKGSASDDVGWINCGAKITVFGDVGNGAFNAAAQGIMYVQGGGGARCDTMTKHNPRFPPPQSWYFRDVGDSFAEFKAGGISIVCGVNPRNPENILGYLPCVGMVGGTIYFRGKIQNYSEKDVKMVLLNDQDWQWLKANMKPFLEVINRQSYYNGLTIRADDWKKLVAYTPQEKKDWKSSHTIDTVLFRKNQWEREVGTGGIFASYLGHDLTLLPYITTGRNRRFKPVWENEKYLPPCVYNCPSKIPSHKRADLIRQDKIQEALELVLKYSPLPATVCGQICPNLCMQGCTRRRIDKPLSINKLGALALTLHMPEKDKPTGRKIAVIGGGPAGLSASWQLTLKGHSVDLYETSNKLGGKLEMCIPRERLPQEILQKEILRIKKIGINVFFDEKVDKHKFDEIYKKYEIVVIACGAHNPRATTFSGSEHSIAAYTFLKNINAGNREDLSNKRIVIIGAGNVGMDVATEAYNCGAMSVVNVDIQKPSAFGKEIETAMKKGTQILWPKFVEKYAFDKKKIFFKDGSGIDADVLIVSIGDTANLDFLPQNINVEQGRIVVNNIGQTSDVKVFAVGDATQLGLVTTAIGQGRITAEAIHYQLLGKEYLPEKRQQILYTRLRCEYYEALDTTDDFQIKDEGARCMSCATCRDCRICEVTCYQGAIKRIEHKDGGFFEYIVDENKCIGCGFCVGVCPCGIWELVENV